MKHNKLLTSAVALGTAAVLALGGTFAWQSISQTALNERSDIVNPGGRLHNDICYTADDMTTNNDIYVENFADEDIFARVRLSEYMEIVMNYGNPDAEVVEVVAGTKTPREDSSYTADNATRQDEFEYTYDVHYYDQDNATDEYWDWTMGSTESDELYYMPTFNLNKDSLVADLNGNYTVTVGGIANYEDNYEGYTVYDAGSTESGTEIYDADTNKLDEVGTDFENLDKYVTDGNIKTIADVEHTAALVGTTNGFISMTEWLALKDAGDETGSYWVYDTDGWVYWSSPITADTATGLLLDSFTLRQVMDDTYYYAIEVEGQFVTANDAGKANSTGFYQDADEAPSEDAETLLEAIGVTIGEAEEDTTPVLEMQDMATYTMTSTVAYISVDSGDTFRVKNTDGSAPAERYLTVSLRGGGMDLEADVDYTYENGLLTITASDDAEWMNENGTALQVGANDFDTDANGVAQIVFGDDGKLTLDTDTDSVHGADITLVPLNRGVTVEDASGAAPAAVEVGFEYESDNGGYTYADGTLTITNADYVGKVLKVTNNSSDDDYGYGFVLVTSAAAGDDTGDTGDDGDGDEVVDTAPILTLKATTLPEVSFVADLEASAGYGARILDQDGQPVAKENLIVMQAGSELSVADEYSDDIEEPCGYENGRLGTNISSDDLEPYQFLVVKLKDTDQFGCFTITYANDPFPCKANADKAVNELFSGASEENVFKIITSAENLVIVPVESLDETLTSNADKALKAGTDYTVTYVDKTGYSPLTKQATVTIDARYAGQMLKCYSVQSDGTTYAANVIFVDPDITESIVPTTPDAPVDEDTAEEIIRTDAQEEGLKVTYKRKANAVYMAGSGACEFKLKPEYNNTVLTDTDKLTLTVNVDGEDKATITGSGFEASTDDGTGWLKCTVSDLFTDKTDDVIVKLTVTYKDGETELTTEAYEITFTKGGTVT